MRILGDGFTIEAWIHNRSRFSSFVELNVWNFGVIISNLGLKECPLAGRETCCNRIPEHSLGHLLLMAFLILKVIVFNLSGLGWYVSDYCYAVPSLVSSSKLENARVQLIKQSQESDKKAEDAYEDYDGILVTSNMPIKKARAFLESESKRGMLFRYIDKELFAVHLIGEFHVHGRMEFIRSFSTVISLFLSAKKSIEIQGDILVPDHSIGPQRSLLPHPTRTPTLVVEFASSESLTSVYRY
jgi:hypothetical protein